MKKYFI